ncbi:uncharacterized protein AMSG_02880 [Thecamonas trahens ATCC 50062]|uniref:ABC transporter domain-containing protein n=1 Tax=Thecamonas trahens ATCC 50062 TaxID=461836 RepID=A0A0L0D2L0_THETB|nr:hypothetical protein AMSG_02880 [Thecamonas trahens ATCC 50062]KNC46426.1 hypothetical protein AMSG_02880 [Thecamonas trahens ATCC 50062]|eukprot:XP_013760717.1 hypothetical protein AMSG_02880 [Thecamonas trahens ATCC 50062]
MTEATALLPPATLRPGRRVTFDNLQYEVEVKGAASPLRILHGVSGCARPGRLLVIMGASGSGKTTLLDILACRKAQGLLKGSLAANGVPLLAGHQAALAEYKRDIGYVLQDDHLEGLLTVRETLMFSARLRLRGVSQSDMASRVSAIIDQLGLADVADALVGNALTKRGISGGQKKRVAIGVELVTSPGALFLDEPTTGLDAFNALHVVRILKDLAVASSRTIVLTLHQPRAALFELFDDLLLLSLGRTVYFGPADGALAALGKRFINPADVLLDTIVQAEMAGDAPRLWAAAEAADSATRLPSPEAALNAARPSQCVLSDSDGTPPRGLPGVRTQIATLVWREVTVTRRSPFTTHVRLAQTLFMTLLVGTLYWQVGRSQASIQSRLGALMFVLIQNAFSTFSIMQTFIEHRPLFQRERGAGLYHPLAYFIARTAIELPQTFFWPSLQLSIAYWMVGFVPGLTHFVTLLGAVVLTTTVSASLMLATGAACPGARVAQIIGSVTLVLGFLFAGFFIKASQVPAPYLPLLELSFFRYAFRIAVHNEFESLTFDCGDNILTCIPDGPAFLQGYGMASVNLPLCFGILAAEIVAFRALAYLFLVTMYRERR